VVFFTDRVRHVVGWKKMIFFLLVLCTVVVGQTCSCPSGSCLSTSVRYCFDTTITVPAFVSASAVEVRVRAQSTDGSVFDLRVLSSSSYTCDGSYSNQYREFSATGVACVDTGKRVVNTRNFTVVFDNENSFYNAPINYLVEWKALYDCHVCDACAPGCNDGPYGSRRLCSRGDQFGGVICRGSEDASSCCVPVATTTAVAASTTAANTTPATTGALASTTAATAASSSATSAINAPADASTSTRTAPATSEQTLICDGEITTCNECIAKSEVGFACDWCSTSGSCHGEGDLFTTCSGTWKETCSALTPTGALYDCLACSGTCASGCNDGQLFGQPRLCSRGDVLVEGGKCRSSEDPSGCCVPSSPRPPSTPTPTKRTDVQSCKLNGSCDAENFCEALSAHLTCIVSSADFCGRYNQEFLSIASQCPDAKTRCSCSTLDDPCQKSFVRCDKVQEDCGSCRSCECHNRCCTEQCRDQQAKFACSQTNGLISSTCSCTGVATAISSTPTVAFSSSVVVLASFLAAYIA
jgi:hypothetical protein